MTSTRFRPSASNTTPMAQRERELHLVERRDSSGQAPPTSSTSRLPSQLSVPSLPSSSLSLSAPPPPPRPPAPVPDARVQVEFLRRSLAAARDAEAGLSAQLGQVQWELQVVQAEKAEAVQQRDEWQQKARAAEAALAANGGRRLEREVKALQAKLETATEETGTWRKQCEAAQRAAERAAAKRKSQRKKKKEQEAAADKIVGCVVLALLGVLACLFVSASLKATDLQTTLRTTEGELLSMRRLVLQGSGSPDQTCPAFEADWLTIPTAKELSDSATSSVGLVPPALPASEQEAAHPEPSTAHQQRWRDKDVASLFREVVRLLMASVLAILLLVIVCIRTAVVLVVSGVGLLGRA